MTGYHFTYEIEGIIQDFLDKEDNEFFYEVISPDPLVGHDTPVAYWCTTVKIRVNMFHRHGNKWMAASFLLDPHDEEDKIKRLCRKAIVSFSNEIKQRDTLLAKT